MGLTSYKKKRNFNQSPEPEGKKNSSDNKLIFVIQRHKASRLHYDFRLEAEGVLKSWAVPKGPSMNPKDKRLAMMVEDHPFDYKDFKGVIPKGNYGAGIVEIWDKGEYIPLDSNEEPGTEKNFLKELKGGSIKFMLKGKKLKGSFALVKLKGKEDNAWLLIKHKDKYAVSTEYNSEDLTPVNSPINKALKTKNPEKKEKQPTPRRKVATRSLETIEESSLKFGRITVPITNTDKIYWPDEQITKGMMISYYQEIADAILPYLKDRPQSLKRNPNGIKDTGFFHKDAGEQAPPWVKSYPVYSESSKKTVDYIICNNKATLAYLNNLGCIELNPWHSRTTKDDYPDYLIIDIDPSAKNDFDDVIEIALFFKELCDQMKVKSFCKTSGATGLHVYIPMGRKYEYEEVKEFAKLLCTIVNESIPGLTSMERSLSKRGNKIYLDYFQNRKSQTIASVYSLRPRSGATASAPLDWKEVKKGMLPGDFNIYNMAERVKKKGDIFKGVLGPGIDMQKSLEILENSGVLD